MLQNTRNDQGEGWTKNQSALNTRRSEKSLDSFEGMNYEQIRQPFNPEQNRDKGSPSPEGNNENNDEL